MMNSLESLCRLCGSEDGIKVDIFQSGSERAKKIHKILPITVNEHDPFPKQICHHCSYKVDEFYEFRTTSIKTQEYFKRKIPWLRGKQPTWSSNGEPPMVEVALSMVNAVSPSEKQICSPSNRLLCEVNEEAAIVIEDSPPYVEHSNETSALVIEQQNPVEPKKSKKSSKTRSLWDTKKRKKKSRKSCKIEKVFMTTMQEYQNIDNDPLRILPVDDIENNSLDNIDENNSGAVNSPRPDHSVVEKGILSDDKGGANIPMPSYMLVTKIPSVGNVYTCERCGRTYLNPQPASQHHCPIVISVEEDRPKEEPQDRKEDVKPSPTKDFYQCSECGNIFTRHSQLVSHQKKHYAKVDYSSDDSFKPFNSIKRKKHHKKRKHKHRLLNTTITSHHDSNSTTSYHNSDITTTNHNHNSDRTTINHSSDRTTINHNSDRSPINHNSDRSPINHNSDRSPINHNSNITTTNHNYGPIEVSRPSFLFGFESVDSKITRHSLLSSDSE